MTIVLIQLKYYTTGYLTLTGTSFRLSVWEFFMEPNLQELGDWNYGIKGKQFSDQKPKTSKA
jgi:hypothetical protein